MLIESNNKLTFTDQLNISANQLAFGSHHAIFKKENQLFCGVDEFSLQYYKNQKRISVLAME